MHKLLLFFASRALFPKLAYDCSGIMCPSHYVEAVIKGVAKDIKDVP